VRTLPRYMLERGWRAWALFDLSMAYRGFFAARNALYRWGVLKQQRLPVPVVVVGSIFVGGTGKTPLTVWLIEQLRARGYTPGVVSRGYVRTSRGVHEVLPTSTPDFSGDEPLLMAQQSGAPVYVGNDRVAAARALLAAHPKVNLIIGDDGLQHIRLARDFEIAVIDARGYGNGFALPAGPLREMPARLARVDAIVSRDAPALPELARALPMRLTIDRLQHAASGEVLTPTAFAARQAKVLAAAGIGNPQNFFDALTAAGIAAQTLPLPDHYDFAQSPFPPGPELAIVITQKDVLKTAHLNDARLWVAVPTTQADTRLIDQIESKLRGRKTA
jgi:tetraacyldisaccharide 4'-kinase